MERQRAERGSLGCWLSPFALSVNDLQAERAGMLHLKHVAQKCVDLAALF